MKHGTPDATSFEARLDSTDQARDAQSNQSVRPDLWDVGYLASSMQAYTCAYLPYKHEPYD